MLLKEISDAIKANAQPSISYREQKRTSPESVHEYSADAYFQLNPVKKEELSQEARNIKRIAKEIYVSPRINNLYGEIATLYQQGKENDFRPVYNGATSSKIFFIKSQDAINCSNDKISMLEFNGKLMTEADIEDGDDFCVDVVRIDDNQYEKYYFKNQTLYKYVHGVGDSLYTEREETFEYNPTDGSLASYTKKQGTADNISEQKFEFDNSNNLIKYWEINNTNQ